MTRHTTTAAAIGIAAILGGPALAGYTITQGSSAPAYTGYTLNFDQEGQPTGVVAANYWQPSWGLTIDAGDGQPVVDEFASGAGWPLGDGNAYYGNFGVFMTFDYDVTEMSIEVWDPSGPPSPFGGGLGVFVMKDGAEVASTFVTPAWGGVGDSWFNITTDGGDTFDEVRILGYGFTPTTYADNLSWNASQAACPWDCDGSGDGVVGINDFLAVLAQWGTSGPCDIDGAGVGINDLLDLLANWGACP